VLAFASYLRSRWTLLGEKCLFACVLRGVLTMSRARISTNLSASFSTVEYLLGGTS
jgi:hypothetical protein